MIMKKMRLLSILLVVVMLFAAGCGKKEEKKVEKDSGLMTDIDDVTYIKVTSGDKSVSLEYADDAWFLEGIRDEWVTQTGVQSMVDATSKITPLREIKNPGALSEYGLDAPTFTVVLKNADKEEVTLYVGAVVGGETEEALEVATPETTTPETTTPEATTPETATPETTTPDTTTEATTDGTTEEEEVVKEYYATTGDKKKVYVISESIVKTLEADKEKLIVEEVDPMESLKNYMDQEIIVDPDSIIVDEDLQEDVNATPDDGNVDDGIVDPEPEEPTDTPDATE